MAIDARRLRLREVMRGRLASTRLCPSKQRLLRARKGDAGQEHD